MATSVSPRRQGRPNVSETMTATSTPRRARSPSRMRRAERSLSSGSSAAQPSSTFERSTPGVGAHEAVARLADDQVAAAAHDADRLLLDDGLVPARVVRVDAGHRALGLRHDLLGDDHDVAVPQVGGGVREQTGQVVAARHLGDALDREHLEPRHAVSTTSARAAASAGPRMIVGTTTQRIPRPPRRPRAPASASSITRVARERRVEPGDARRPTTRGRARGAAGRPAPSARRRRRWGTRRRRRRDGRRPRRGRPARPAPGRSTRSGSTGAITTTVASAERVEHARAPGGRRRPPRTAPRDGHVVVATHEVLLEADLALVGHGDHACGSGSSVPAAAGSPSPHAAAISAVTSDSGAPARSRSVRYRWVARSRSPRLNQARALG